MTQDETTPAIDSAAGAEQQLADRWARDGFVIVRQLLLPEVTRQLGEIAEVTLAQWRQCNPETGEPGGNDEATTMRHLNHPGYYRQNPLALSQMLSACADQRILRAASTLLGSTPLFRCTSLFFNPLANSRDGGWHRDSQFHCPDEADEKQMILAGGDVGRSIQLQIALVPSDDVEVVAGSHLRWDTDAEYAIRRADGGSNNTSGDMPDATRVPLEPGDAVAFNPLGLHRGRYHTDRPRRTLMLTYTCSQHPRFDYFSNQPWFDEPDYLDGLQPPAQRFFEEFVDEYGPEWRQNGDEN